MNNHLKTNIELISSRNGIPIGKLADSCNRISTLINTGNARVIFTILENNPPPWLQDLFLDDSFVDRDGKPVYGYFLASLNVSKAIQSILFCYALKSRKDLKESIPDDNITSLRKNIHVDDITYNDFIDDIFPHLDPQCQLLGTISVSRILNLDADIVSFLKNFKGSIELNKSQLFDQQIATAIQSFTGKLCVSDIKTLELTELRRLISLEKYALLPSAKNVDDNAIPLLVEKFKGKLGIKNDDFQKIYPPPVNDYKLLVLTKSAESSIYLPANISLSPLVAKQLAKTRKALDFRTMTSVDPLVANALETHKGKLILDGVKQLDLNEESNITKHIGNLSLKGIREIQTPELAKKLVSSAETNGELHFTHMGSLQPEIARELARFKGALLIDALQQIDDDTAKELAAHQGYLRLLSVTKLSERAAGWLLDKPGKIFCQFLRNECYRQLTSQQAVSNIMVLAFRNELLPLDHLKTFDEPMAEILVKHQGGLQLNGLEVAQNQVAGNLVQSIAVFCSRYRGKSIQIKLMDPLTNKMIFTFKKEYPKLPF